MLGTGIFIITITIIIFIVHYYYCYYSQSSRVMAGHATDEPFLHPPPWQAKWPNLIPEASCGDSDPQHYTGGQAGKSIEH